MDGDSGRMGATGLDSLDRKGLFAWTSSTKGLRTHDSGCSGALVALTRKGLFDSPTTAFSKVPDSDSWKWVSVTFVGRSAGSGLTATESARAGIGELLLPSWFSVSCSVFTFKHKSNKSSRLSVKKQKAKLQTTTAKRLGTTGIFTLSSSHSHIINNKTTNLTR